MFSKLFNKISTFGEHHQAFIAIVITFSIICITWGVENILEDYVFPGKPFYGYLISMLGGLFLLWLTKHVILHVM